MRELQLNIEVVRSWFDLDKSQRGPVTLVRASDASADTWVEQLTGAVRRCYVADDFLDQRAAEIGVEPREIVAALLPDPGSVMAGDFGEILAFVFLGASQLPSEPVAPKKWRLKHDRTKAASHSDVVQFVLPRWPDSSDEDLLICAEVKTKSTNGASTPIASAIADSEKDRLGRLAKTLVWLRERSLVEDLGSTSMAMINRFLEASDHPSAGHQYWAVAVICSSLLDAELEAVPESEPADCRLAVISVPDLKRRYQEVFAAVSGADSDEARGT